MDHPTGITDSLHAKTIQIFWESTERHLRTVASSGPIELLDNLRSIKAALPDYTQLGRIDPEIAEILITLKGKLQETTEICTTFNSCCQNLIDYFTNDRMKALITESINRGERNNLASFFQELHRRQKETTEVFVRFKDSVEADKRICEETRERVRNEQTKHKTQKEVNAQEVVMYGKKFKLSLIGAVVSAPLLYIPIVGLPLLSIFTVVAIVFKKKEANAKRTSESQRCLEEAYKVTDRYFSNIRLQFEDITSNLKICHICLDKAENVIMRIVGQRVNVIENPVEQINTETDIKELVEEYEKLTLHSQTASRRQENLDDDDSQTASRRKRT